MDSVVVQQVVQSVQVPSARSVWEMSGVIALAGAAGGFVNALLNSGNGYSFKLPQAATNGFVQLGIAGNILLGAFAALITWGLYGPLTDAVLLGNVPAGQLAANLTLITVTGAIVAGIGGARVISNEVDKRLLRSAGAGAAQQPTNPQLAVDIATLPPAKALANAVAAKDQAAKNQPAADQSGDAQAGPAQAGDGRAANGQAGTAQAGGDQPAQAGSAQAGDGQPPSGQAGGSLDPEGPAGPGTDVGGGGGSPEAGEAGSPEAGEAGSPEAGEAGSPEAGRPGSQQAGRPGSQQAGAPAQQETVTADAGR